MAPRLRPLWMVSALLIGVAARIGAQNPTPDCSQPAQVVQAQVDAFNHHDLEAFVATYAPDVELRMLPADSALIRGQAALRGAYDFLHHVPAEFGVDITERVIAGCFIIDHERLRASGTDPAKEAGVAIYQVVGRLIRRVWVIPI
jgi:hypothetical protein